MASEPRPESSPAHALSLSNPNYKAMTVLHRRTGRPQQAAELDARPPDLWRHWDHKLPGNSFVRHASSRRAGKQPLLSVFLC